MHTPFTPKFIASLSAAVLAVAAFTAATPGNAQTAQLKVNVPFGFESGTSHLPAGVYKIYIDGGTRILRIEGQKSSIFQMTMPDRTVAPSETSKVVFRHYGSQYILKEVWVAGSTSHVHTPKSKLEKELELAQNKPSSQGDLALLAMPR